MSKKQHIKFIRILLLRENILLCGMILCAVQVQSQESNPSQSLFHYTFNVVSLEGVVPEDAILYYRGNILDVNGWPIMGVEIEDQSTCKIITSDASGEFSIASHPKNMLLFKSESFYTKHVVLGEAEKLTVTLEELPYVNEVYDIGPPTRAIAPKNLIPLSQILSGLEENNKTFFGRIFHSIGNLFRSNE